MGGIVSSTSKANNTPPYFTDRFVANKALSRESLAFLERLTHEIQRPTLT
jgi:hypothetical protein